MLAQTEHKRKKLHKNCMLQQKLVELCRNLQCERSQLSGGTNVYSIHFDFGGILSFYPLSPSFPPP